MNNLWCVRRGAPPGCIGMARVAPGVVAELLRPGLTMLRPFGVLLRGMWVGVYLMMVQMPGLYVDVCLIFVLPCGSSVGADLM